jgi:hypothetical protein
MQSHSELYVVVAVLALIGAGTVVEVAIIRVYLLVRLYKDLFKRG